MRSCTCACFQIDPDYREKGHSIDHHHDSKIGRSSSKHLTVSRRSALHRLLTRVVGWIGQFASELIAEMPDLTTESSRKRIKLVAGYLGRLE